MDEVNLKYLLDHNGWDKPQGKPPKTYQSPSNNLVNTSMCAS